MLWLALHLPLLPLEVFASSPYEKKGNSANKDSDDDSEEDPPLIISETFQNRAVVTFCNKSAMAKGIEAGMNTKLAQSLSDTLLIRERIFALEAKTLENIATYLYRFSPYIFVYSDNKMMVEISRSLKLFKGLDNFMHLLVTELKSQVFKEQAFTFETRLSLNPELASLSCSAPFKNPIFTYHLKDLDFLSLFDLEMEEKELLILESSGIKSLKDILQIPLAVLGKQLNQDSMAYLQSLQGKTSKSYDFFEPADHFSDQLNFIEELDNTEQILFPLQRSLQNLCHLLHSKQLAVLSFEIVLKSRYQDDIVIKVQFASGQYHLKKIMLLTRLQLEKIKLAEPINQIHLSSQDFCPQRHFAEDLFPSTLGEFQHGALDQLFIESICARLGADSVNQLKLADEHRPEQASVCLSFLQHQQSLPKGIRKNLDDSAVHNGCEYSQSRPLWLLTKPRELHFKQDKLYYFGPLNLINDAERIETGWWDKNFIKRDYYIAQHPKGEFYWVFQDHLQAGLWFLHGTFS